VGEGGMPDARPRPAARDGGPLLEVRDLEATDDRGVRVLDRVSFRVDRGEIVGVAGVAGNGQPALARVLTGRMRPVGGEVRLRGEEAGGRGPGILRRMGVADIPEDRDAEGLVAGFSLVENAILGDQRLEPFRSGIRLDRAACRAGARELVERYDVRAESLDDPVGGLSGGNRQKLLVGRELARMPDLVVAAQPTRGLDLRAAAFVRDQLAAARDRGAGVLLISQDLEEILALSDRILVMVRGRVAADVPRGEATEERLGAWMTGPGNAE
jgi:general nucleoside transport system ATP-binding protein